MPVYVMNNMTIHDAAQYQDYVRQFMPIFLKYGGTLLVAQDIPEVIEGSWPFSRTIVASFQTRAEFERWYHSDDYQAIAALRHASTISNVTLLEGVKARLGPAAR